MNTLNIIGQIFSSLTVLERVENDRHGKSQWKCRCACGKEIIASGAHLKSGHTKSCNCLQKQTVADLRTTHGHTRDRSPEYRIWASMKDRCLRPNSEPYKNYGGRGIAVCERWLKFEKFIADMGRRPSKDLALEREDNDGPYAPWNCRWATRTEQNNNKRNSLKIKIKAASF